MLYSSGSYFTPYIHKGTQGRIIFITENSSAVASLFCTWFQTNKQTNKVNHLS